MSKTAKIVILLIVVIAVGWGIGKYTTPSASPENGTNINTGTDLGAEGPEAAPEASAVPEPTDQPVPGGSGNGTSGNNDAEMVVAEPESIAVMVNKQYSLPEQYKPSDLVYPDVPFIFSEKIEKRMLRREAAAALEEMFAGAKADGVYLAGVSGYRSESTQKRLFNNYVARDGEEKARTYSAMPGHSEHQTGLAIDLSGRDGKCAAESCFAGTKEAEWLAAHAAEYGYIIRFLEGKEAITGYKYEPWHVRYVGKEIAASIAERGITLEEYYDAVPVSN
ncbi:MULTISPECIES: M15 family metallopeptidase [unclassified Paenibacillus]|uniref:M15 family metallopeptidase n=1 Tax=unclassified Paenibacillus TaxID=185978 RepID=UPI0003E27B68|nr:MULTISPECIES: M15 family metallopeptidase [unclassified Paenibacillus]ETT56550.1 peptidase M15B and M15C DD-carboxypeptidase VanY/endolysin [Paenibacillus sp. FSL R7-269]OMF91315.1 peptidase M15 [Paenibacillus sp. FSL R7-0337]